MSHSLYILVSPFLLFVLYSLVAVCCAAFPALRLVRVHILSTYFFWSRQRLVYNTQGAGDDESFSSEPDALVKRTYIAPVC